MAATLAPGGTFSPPIGSECTGGPDDTTVPLYRFYSPLRRVHLYTTDPNDAVMASSCFMQETILGSLYKEPGPGRVPLWGIRSSAVGTRYTVFCTHPQELRKVRFSDNGG